MAQPMSAPMNTVILDLATHPDEQWAVILGGRLLPIRFATEGEARRHLNALLMPELKAGSAA